MTTTPPRPIPPHLQGNAVAVPNRSAARGVPAPHSAAEKVRIAVRGVGEILITLGLVLLLFCGYQLWWTDLTSNREAGKELTQLTQTFAAPPAPVVAGKIPPLATPAPGEPFARMYVPRFGKGWVRPIIQGVTLPDLHKGVGHYAKSALPGQIGNFAVAGHRTTNGHPFRKINTLEVGDQIFVETKDAWYTYTVTDPRLTVSPKDTYVVAPVPVKGKTGDKPTKAIMTMTSCHPPYSAAQRMVVHAALTDTRSRTLGPPAGAPAGAS